MLWGAIARVSGSARSPGGCSQGNGGTVANLTKQWFEGNRKWWVAGAIAFSVGLTVGAVTNRTWQRALATGAIALSGAAVATAIIERRRLLTRLRPLPPADLNYADLLALEFPTPAAQPALSAALTPELRPPEAASTAPAPMAPPSDREDRGEREDRVARDRGFGLRRSGRAAPSPANDSRAIAPAHAPIPPEDLIALERTVERTATRKQHLEAVIAVLRQEEEELKGSLANRKGIHQKLAQDISTLEAERQTLALEREELATAIATLQHRREALDRELTAAETLRDDLEHLTAEQRKHQAAIAQLQTSHGTLQTEHQQLTDQVARLSSQRQDLERAIAAATATIDQLNGQLGRQRQALQDCQAQIANREAYYRTLLTKLNALERQRVNLPSAIAQLKQEHATLTERCQTTRAELDRLRQHIALRQQTLQDLQTQIGSLETRRTLILKIFHNLKQQNPEDLQRILDALSDLDSDL